MQKKGFLSEHKITVIVLGILLLAAIVTFPGSQLSGQFAATDSIDDATLDPTISPAAITDTPATQGGLDANPIHGEILQINRRSTTNYDGDYGSSKNPWLESCTATFTHLDSNPNKAYQIGCFYAGDGAETNPSQDGNVFRTRFYIPHAGRWTYSVSSSAPGVGTTSPIAFTADPMDTSIKGYYKNGVLKKDPNSHFLRFENGLYWHKHGTNDPENFMAYKETFQAKIDFLDYISERGLNSIYIISNNIEYVDKINDAYLLLDPISSAEANNDPFFDLAKVEEWNKLFNYMQEKEIAIHFVFQDDAGFPMKNSNFNRNTYIRNLVAMFCNNPAIEFNVGEEFDLTYGESTAFTLAPQIAKIIKGYDPYGHAVTVHFRGKGYETWEKFVNSGDGFKEFDITSFQDDGANSLGRAKIDFYYKDTYNKETLEFKQLVSGKGKKLAVSWDELARWTTVTTALLKVNRNNGIYPIFFAGGHLEDHWRHKWGNDQKGLYYTSMDLPFRELGYAGKFMESIPFWEMTPNNALLRKDGGSACGTTGSSATPCYATAKQGEVYAGYFTNSGTYEIDLTQETGDWDISWFNPQTGATQSGGKIQGGAWRDITTPPGSEDWAFTAKSSTLAEQPKPYTVSPVYLAQDQYTITIWGENLNTNLQVEWNNQLYPTEFKLQQQSKNEIILTVPTSLRPLELRKVYKIRLYDGKVYSKPMTILVTHEKASYPVAMSVDPKLGGPIGSIDHIWGEWGLEGPVLQQGNIFSYVDMFDTDTAVGAGKRTSRCLPPFTNCGPVGLPVMGYQICSDAYITYEQGKPIKIIGNMEPTGGWRWDGCGKYPTWSNEWWAQLHPPSDLKAGDYLLHLRTEYSTTKANTNKVSIKVLPPKTPPFIISFNNRGAVEGYSEQFSPITVKGYNLNSATHVYINGKQPINIQPISSTKATFTLPTGLTKGTYRIQVGNSNGPTSNSYFFRVMEQGSSKVTQDTLVHINFNDIMYANNAKPDRFKIFGSTNFIPSRLVPGNNVPLFWKENINYIYFDGDRGDGHQTINLDEGTIEILGYCPLDFPQPRDSPVLRHGYEHIVTFHQGGDWHDKEVILIRTYYTFTDNQDPKNPNHHLYWKIWDYWNDNIKIEAPPLPAPQKWGHIEVKMKDGYSIPTGSPPTSDVVIVITDQDFEKELGIPNKALNGKCFDIKFVYDFVGTKKGHILVRESNTNIPYKDVTFVPSSVIANNNDRISFKTLQTGDIEIGTEKRHNEHLRILEESQPDKSNGGGTMSEFIIRDTAQPPPPPPPKPPVMSLTPSGPYSRQQINAQKIALTITTTGSLENLDLKNVYVNYILTQGTAKTYGKIPFPTLWEVESVAGGYKYKYPEGLFERLVAPAGTIELTAGGASNEHGISSQVKETYIVSSSGGKIINANPSNYQDYLSGAKKLQPGDTLKLAAGDYTGGLHLTDIHGKAGNEIIIEGPTGTQKARFLGSISWDTVELVRSSYIQIKNLEIDNQNLYRMYGIRGVQVNEWAHHITLENLYLHGMSGDQQSVGIGANNGWAWNWVIRNNIIEDAGTGMYLGNYQGLYPFVAGVIENNLITNSIGYNIEIKQQDTWSNLPAGVPTEKTQTIIRNNVFSKGDLSATGSLNRPNVWIGTPPPSGPGSDNEYIIYSNLFYQNPTEEALIQVDGQNLYMYNNLLVNTMTCKPPETTCGNGIRIWRKGKDTIIFGNTIVTSTQGTGFTSINSNYNQQIIGNAIFSPTQISAPSSVVRLDNTLDTLQNAGNYLNNPTGQIGQQLDLYPKIGSALKASVTTTAFQGILDWSKDFNSIQRAWLYRGAYEGEGINPGWKLAFERKV